MRGKVTSTKYPVGLYHVQITDVRAGVDSKGKDLIIVHYVNLPDSPRPDDTWKERMKNPSMAYLQALGEPFRFGDSWDTENWRGKELWIDVKYTEDAEQWSRYGHYRENPELKEPEPPAEVNGKGVPADEDVPF